jgi:radical SAM superfamily enzyme YgiQ (UPF0313 family)
MKILLVSPPQPGAARYGKLAAAGSYLPPLGLASLAAMVRDRHEVRIVDGTVEAVTLTDLEKLIDQWRPAVLGVMTLTSTFYGAVALCVAAKRVDDRIVTVLGGAHPSAQPVESLANPAVDVVVAGEGEETFRELIEELEGGGDLRAVPGLYLRQAEKGVAPTAPRPPIADLDALPWPARDLLPMHLYHPSAMHYRQLPAFSVMCGRGCPYQCTFCSCSKVFPGRMRLRSPENVIAEIRMLVDRFGAREILIWDDLFGISRPWTLRFCELIAPLGLSWSAWMRVDTVDPELLGLMARSGCWHISYGVESGNQAVLDAIRKQITVGQVRRAFAWTHEAGMEARGTFILGFPGETPATMRETIELAIDIDADYAQFQLLTPYPGSALWEATHGDRCSDDLAQYTIWFPVYVPAGMTAEELAQMQREAYRRFYLRPSYVLRRLRSIRSFADLRRNLVGGLSVLRL